MTRWNKLRLYRIELANALGKGLEGHEAEQYADEQTEIRFAELSDRLYDEKRDRDMENHNERQ